MSFRNDIIRSIGDRNFIKVVTFGFLVDEEEKCICQYPLREQ